MNRRNRPLRNLRGKSHGRSPPQLLPDISAVPKQEGSDTGTIAHNLFHSPKKERRFTVDIRRRTHKFLQLATLILLVATLLAACGGETVPTQSTTAPAEATSTTAA